MKKMNTDAGSPNVLKLTQASVDMLRQISSFRTASARKKAATRQVSLRQPSSLSGRASDSTKLSHDFPRNSPNSSVPPKIR